MSVHRRDRCTSTLSNQGSVTANFAKAAFRTCVSVHRRDRCTRTLSNLHSTVSGILLHLNTSQVQLPPRFLFTGFGISFHKKVQFFLRTLLLLLSCATLLSLPLSPSLCPGVSVQRRDRCTRSPLPFLLVLACLSIDVTGALVLLLYSFSQRL